MPFTCKWKSPGQSERETRAKKELDDIKKEKLMLETATANLAASKIILLKNTAFIYASLKIKKSRRNRTRPS